MTKEEIKELEDSVIHSKQKIEILDDLGNGSFIVSFNIPSDEEE